MIAGNATQTPQRRARGLVVRNTDGFVMVMGPANADPLKLEGLARAVWDALAAPATAAEICAHLAPSYGVETDTPNYGALSNDVEATLQMLAAAEIVTDAA